MATWNSKLLSMTLEHDFLNANGGTPVSGTWYEVTNYSGSGRVTAWGIDLDTTYNTGEVRITTDGNAYTISKTDLYNLLDLNGTGSSGEIIFSESLEFTETLVMEVRRDGDTNNIVAFMKYGILSEEWKREIIPANDPVPDKDGNPRTVTYNDDVMLVWFCKKVIDGQPTGHISNKVVKLPKHKLSVSSGNGTINGQVVVPAFNTTVNGERLSWSTSTDSSYDGIYSVKHNGESYSMTIEDGVGSCERIQRLAVGDFLGRFDLADELPAIIAASAMNSQVAAYYDWIKAQTNGVDLLCGKVEDFLDCLISNNIGGIDETRKDQILPDTA